MTQIIPVETPQAIETVAALARDIWTRHYTPIIGVAQVAYMLEKFQSAPAIQAQIASGYEYYLVTEATVPAGYLALVPNLSEGRMMLSKLYILPERQGQGLGKAAMAFAIRRCADLGLRKLWLTVNKRNDRTIAFYTSAGFVRVEAVATDIGGGFVMDDYIMARDVP